MEKSLLTFSGQVVSILMEGGVKFNLIINFFEAVLTFPHSFKDILPLLFEFRDFSIGGASRWLLLGQLGDLLVDLILLRIKLVLQ